MIYIHLNSVRCEKDKQADKQTVEQTDRAKTICPDQSMPTLQQNRLVNNDMHFNSFTTEQIYRSFSLAKNILRLHDEETI